MTRETAMPDTICIAHIDDFQSLVAGQLSTVVDPMVFRAGEVFLQGRKGLQGSLSEEGAWDFLDKNLEALRFFFDALILNERLPVFNYSDTFDHEANFDARAFRVLRDASKQEVLTPVEVQYDVYMAVKRNAVERLEKKICRPGDQTTPWIDADLAESIIRELSQSAYRWEIGLGSPRIEAELKTDQDRALARFLLGGMVFGQYADLMDSEHWLQPKRSRLFVQATVERDATKSEDERRLFERLGSQYRLPFGRAWQPTFMHYILARADKREDIPTLVARLRHSGAVRDYRAWRHTAIGEWRRKGGISQESLATIHRLRMALAGEGITDQMGETSVSWVETAGALAAATEPTMAVVAGVAKTVIKTAPPAWDYVQGLLPGRRHVKLLAESIRLRQQYPHIEKAVKTLWNE
jgi:hypothetical protein